MTLYGGASAALSSAPHRPTASLMSPRISRSSRIATAADPAANPALIALHVARGIQQPHYMRGRPTKRGERASRSALNQRNCAARDRGPGAITGL